MCAWERWLCWTGDFACIGLTTCNSYFFGKILIWLQDWHSACLVWEADHTWFTLIWGINGPSEWTASPVVSEMMTFMNQPVIWEVPKHWHFWILTGSKSTQLHSSHWGGGPVCFHHWKLPSNMNLTLKTISVTKTMLQAMNFQLNQLFFPFFSQSFWSAAIMFWVVLVSSTV